MMPFSRILLHGGGPSHALAALSSDLLGAVLPDGRLRPANAAWQRVLGRSLEELRDQPFLSLLHPEDRADLFAACEEVRAGGLDLPRVEARARRADGGWSRLEWSLAPGPARDELLLAGRDLTELAALRESLRAVQPLAQLGRLALGLVHDVNRLLDIISGCAAVLKGQLAPAAPGQRDLEVIKDTARLGGELARGFAEALKHAPAAGPADLNAAAQRSQRLLSRAMPRVHVGLELDPQAGWVPLSEPRLAQILLNLAVNARDAMGGEGSLIISTHRATGFSVLSVSDSGPGMSAAVQSRLFEPFFTTKPADEGTGLGLASVRELAASCGGSVAVRSRPGCGTTVLVRLPSA